MSPNNETAVELLAEVIKNRLAQVRQELRDMVEEAFRAAAVGLSRDLGSNDEPQHDADQQSNHHSN
jgi:hypothetical protein